MRSSVCLSVSLSVCLSPSGDFVCSNACVEHCVSDSGYDLVYNDNTNKNNWSSRSISGTSQQDLDARCCVKGGDVYDNAGCHASQWLVHTDDVIAYCQNFKSTCTRNTVCVDHIDASMCLPALCDAMQSGVSMCENVTLSAVVCASMSQMLMQRTQYALH